ncbi:hypothetical protein N1851_002081 [Merluccius polli]|uniref:Uncharacterized protein n=1 Tax=Merluccius polli TaxID=89951 RepID=A0AA47NAS9_MERPO|nr:hypothetical protein N1851_002081 [Merluccius polli]
MVSPPPLAYVEVWQRNWLKISFLDSDGRLGKQLSVFLRYERGRPISHSFPGFEVLPCDPSLPRPPLAPCCSSHQIQDNATDLEGCQQNLRPHAPTISAGRLLPPSLRASKGRIAKSQLFSVLVPLWWSKLPADVRTAESLTSFCKRLKTHLFRVHLDSA